jgi:hypothetical protein
LYVGRGCEGLDAGLGKEVFKPRSKLASEVVTCPEGASGENLSGPGAIDVLVVVPLFLDGSRECG